MELGEVEWGWKIGERLWLRGDIMLDYVVGVSELLQLHLSKTVLCCSKNSPIEKAT